MAILDTARLHAPLLVVLTPLIGAAMAAGIGGARASWAVASMSLLAMAALALDLAARTLLDGAAQPHVAEGLSLAPDGVGVFTAALIGGLGALAMVSAGAPKADLQAAPMALALLALMAAGWSGAALAGDFISMALAGEAAWLAGVGLVALSSARDRAGMNSAFRMFCAGGVAAMFMLLGVGLIARGAGGVEVANLATPRAPGLAAAGAAIMVLALLLKAGVAPLHAWTGSAYSRAGSIGVLALGTLGVAGPLALVIRVTAFVSSSPALGAGLSTALAAIGTVSIAIGSVQAIGTRSLARLVAYSSAAQAGVVLIGLALGSPAGLAAALVQLFALTAGALALLGAAATTGGVRALASLDGLGRRAPLASAAITAGALSQMGAPLTIGFLGRYRLIEAAVGADWWWAMAAVIAVSLAAAFYGGRLIERLYFRKSSEPYRGDADPWRLALAPALIASVLAIALGLGPALLLQAAHAATAMLAGGGA